MTRLMQVMLPVMLCASVAQAGPSMTTLWKARGLEALERLETAPATKPNSPERYRDLLEGAFMLHASGKTLVHSADENGEAFHIILNGGGDTGLFDLVYLFNFDGTPLGTRVASLPKGWTILFMREKEAALAVVMEHRRTERGIVLDAPPIPLVVGTGHCMLIFDLNDPFNPFVMELALDSPAKERGAEQAEKPKKASPPPKKPASAKTSDL
jgi:hypothetical protein